MGTKLVPMPESTREILVSSFSRQTSELYDRQVTRSGNKTFATMIQKAVSKSVAETSRGITTGLKLHPFDMNAVGAFMTSNPHHSTCIQTKVACTVGLGFQTEESKARQKAGETRLVPFEQSKVDQELNGICDISFHDVLTKVDDDFEQRGNGLMEVKREEPRDDAPIVGIHAIPANEAHLFVENKSGIRHWQVNSREGDQKKFAMFGDLEDFITRNSLDGTNVSEVIHFPEPSILSRWYGFPGWLPAVAAIELVQCMRQERFDFYLNRGVPEFFLFILGQKLSPKDWGEIEKALKANIGLGNAHKTLALNLENPSIKIQLEKLAMDNTSSDFTDVSDTLSLDIVSAHRVPPLLAGIIVPGRLGVSNELPNALVAFQALVIGPKQRIFKQTLGTTLGNPELNGGLKLVMEDFTLNQITDTMNLAAMNTVGGMRESLPSAVANGRNLNAGMKN